MTALPSNATTGIDPQPIPVYHRVNGEQHLAFSVTRRFRIGDVMMCSHVIKPDGSHPLPGEILVCGTCKQPIYPLNCIGFPLDRY